MNSFDATLAVLQFGPFTFPDSPLGAILAFVTVAVYILLSVLGCTMVFRGTRDYLAQAAGREKPGIVDRLAATCASLMLFCTPGGVVVGVLGMLGGSGPRKAKKDEEAEATADKS